MKGVVYVKFPKTGLGNLLLIWARAKVFAHINGLQLVTSPWWGFRLGAWLRREKKKRLYWGYFKEDSWLNRINVRLRKYRLEVVHEPQVQVLDNTAKDKFFLFDQVITDNDLFGAIREHRDFIKEELLNLLNPALKEQLKNYEIPFIALHIRRGDFKFGNPITPLSFFADGINAARAAASKELPVTIFTDADRREVADLLSMPGVKLTENKPDILDILLLSKSKIIILSQSSTFSYWGAFLSDAIILKPHNDWQGNLRSGKVNNSLPEIKWQEGSEECRIILKETVFKKISQQTKQYQPWL